MAVKSYKMGPGTLKLGANQINAQVRSCVIKCTPSVTRTDPTPVLSGESIAGTVTRTWEWTVEAVVLQDIDAGGLTDWTWTNKGTVQPLEYVPNTVKGRKVTGVTVVSPLDFGGEVGGERPTAPLNWPVGGTATPDADDVQGDPTLGAAA